MSVDQTGVSKTENLAGELFQDPPPTSPVIGTKLLYIQMYLKIVAREPVNGERSKHPILKQEGGLGTALI